jgi:hypothetical protein
MLSTGIYYATYEQLPAVMLGILKQNIFSYLDYGLTFSLINHIFNAYSYLALYRHALDIYPTFRWSTRAWVKLLAAATASFLFCSVNKEHLQSRL